MTFNFKRLRLGLALVASLFSLFLFTQKTSAQNLDAQPILPGIYTSSAQHPRVFITPAELRDMVKRINTTGSFSSQIFSKLANQVKVHLAAKTDWSAVYCGCDLEVYLHAFSYEPLIGYAGEIRTIDQLRAAMNIKPEMLPPNGAAIVASRLALYAALIKNGAHTKPDFPSPDQAAALAKRILLAWAERGFRDQEGTYLKRAEQFCDDHNHFVLLKQSAAGLQVARGIIYSVHAQDLLQSLGVFSAADVTVLNAFHAAMFNLIREASNFAFTLPEVANRSDRTCERFSNHFGAHLLGLLSIARFFDDGRKFNAVLYGNDRSIPVSLPWVTYFDHAIYGENDTPIACYKNPGPDSLTNHPSFQTSIVAPGEIEDRYRNANPSQGFGYTLGVLAGLFNTAELMRNAGFDAFAYRGTHRQSIEMAAQYYACYGKYVGFKKTVTADNARACPDYQQYIGQIVNGLETDIVMGAYYFPNNATINELEAAAKAGAGANLFDPLRFGRWRD
ncbi:MAG TPA: hypothetical protein VK445_00900 [Dissulfurispiraceae bacterium]|nr:hypothetical protein [Dissulfurispiraceae bacterium]